MLDVDNPLAEPSRLPFGLPDFQAVRLEHLAPALQEGMAEQRREWEAVASDPHAPTVENTVEAVDRSGDLLERASSVFRTLASSVGGAELDVLQARFAPRFAEHRSAFLLDRRIYERYRTLQRSGGLDAETAHVVHEVVRDFERAGVGLGDADRRRVRDLDARIASVEADYGVRVSHQLAGLGLAGTDPAELDGLDRASREAAVEAGPRHGAAWWLPLQNFSSQLAQGELRSPVTRRRLLAASLSRGLGADPATDTRALVLELARLRAERARLLGFADHASAVMDAETIPGPDVARRLLDEVGAAAHARVGADARRLRALALADPRGDGMFEAADWPYYENRLRREALGFDAQALRPYLELGRVVRDGVFYAAHRLYGIDFVERGELAGWSEDCRAWEVRDVDGSPLGLFVADYYARPGKSGGAWMSTLVEPRGLTGTLPVVTNTANFAKPAPGRPALLAWDGVETCFHEFGHALHALFSRARYRRAAGTNVPPDFVEMPSQLNEMWAYHPEVLGHFARHWETGEPMPADMRRGLARSKTFGQGFATSEFVQAALIDHAWHRLSPSEVPTSVEDVEGFERRALARHGVAEGLVPPRYRSTYFAHAFAGGYDAQYYAYMWAETLVGELEQWFREDAAADGDGGLNRRAGETLRRELLSRGDSRPPLDSFRAVVGHDADPRAVLRRRGLAAVHVE